LNGQDDSAARLIVNGGAVVNAGDFRVERSSPNGGLLLSNGVMTVSSIDVGTGPARAFSTIYGGVLTNTGTFLIGDRTNAATSNDRRVQFLIRGGSVVSTASTGVIMPNLGNLPTNLVTAAI